LSKLKLAIVSTHPIQYNAPLFQALALQEGIHPRVFYTWSQAAQGPQFDAGFERAIQWDIPLLDGYEHEFVPNVSAHPSPERRGGVVNPTLIPAIESWGAQAILVYGWNLSSHLRAMRHFKGRIPVFFRGDSTLLDPQSAWRSVLRRAALTWVYRHIDVALAVGQNSADYFRWCGVPASRIVLAPHSIDNTRFSDASGAAEQQALGWRSELGIATETPVLLFAGKFIEKKDPLLLLDAFGDIGRAAHLVFVGGGALENSLRDRAKSRPAVHFMPLQNQRAMPAVYRLGDVFVLPSRGPGETWGLALNEAMASGRAVIVGSRAGGARDLITPGVNGWVFESANRAALTDTLRKAADCGVEGLRSMGREARASIAGWSTQIAAARIAAAVTDLKH
jgi:glycosyltransferase involved in cell wall biosynthesis